MSARDGGPAFPTGEERGFNSGEPGMTLRDYFAASAPITVEDAMLACGCSTHSIGMLDKNSRAGILGVLAELRGDYADAMLAERAK